MNELKLLQIYRTHHAYGSEMYRFFDRAICHQLLMDSEYMGKSCGPSVTETLYHLAERMFREAEAA